jgi:hypothetical protein
MEGLIGLEWSMKRNFRHLLSILILLFCGLFGWWVVRDLKETEARHPSSGHVQGGAAIPRRAPKLSGSRPVRDEFQDGTTVEMFGSLTPGEVILRFPSDDSYAKLLGSLRSSPVRLVDQLDPLKAVRLRYDDWADFSDLLAGEEIIAYEALPKVVPTPNHLGLSRQEGVVGFDDGLLSWLGVTADHSSWGAGVKVAVLDTGVVPVAALPGVSRSIAITPFPSDLAKTHGHGTAVASLIASNDPAAPGVAPAAEIISIRVGDESGQADSFALAAGILAAVEAGAQIINISMGTHEDNPLIQEAVRYADARGVVIVAASGNSEQADASYPAAYPSVISVGAVDARGEHLDFSNYGTYLSVTAPGYLINTVWPGDRYASISGTSASAPIVAGAIAATMSHGSGLRMTARAAAEIVMKYSNEAGIPGPDSEYGVGIIDLGRIMSRGLPGIVDAAITHHTLLASDRAGQGGMIQVSIQNRGTSPLINTLLETRTPFGVWQFNATMIAPGGIETFSIPVRLGDLPRGKLIEVSSVLTLGMPVDDISPGNNRRSDVLSLR